MQPELLKYVSAAVLIAYGDIARSRPSPTLGWDGGFRDLTIWSF
jgi:hypothetical protein